MIRNAGFLRKLQESDDIYLIIGGSRLTLRGTDIPRLLAGTPKPLFLNQTKAGEIRVWKRYGHDDLIEVLVFNLSYVIRINLFLNVWNGVSPYCCIQERVPDCWENFGGVTA
jgi:hypothetical protein